MQKFSITTAIVGIFAAGAIGLAGTATAVPTGGGSAADTIKALQDMGYAVQINGTVSGPVSQCIVTGVHGLSNSDPSGQRIDPTAFTTAYVDISCPSSDD
jgi:hypothetical protein